MNMSTDPIWSIEMHSMHSISNRTEHTFAHGIWPPHRVLDARLEERISGEVPLFFFISLSSRDLLTRVDKLP